MKELDELYKAVFDEFNKTSNAIETGQYSVNDWSYQQGRMHMANQVMVQILQRKLDLMMSKLGGG